MHCYLLLVTYYLLHLFRAKKEGTNAMEKSFQTETQYKTIPKFEELPELERRLQFHPSTVTDPKVLTREQVAAYNQDGYLKGFRIFDSAEIAAHRQFLDETLAQVIAAGGNSYSIISAHVKYGPVYDLIKHPRIVAYVKDLLGEDVIGWGAHYFCKM